MVVQPYIYAMSSLATIQFDLSFLPPASITAIEDNDVGFFTNPYLSWILDLDAKWEMQQDGNVLRGSDGVDAIAYQVNDVYTLTIKSPPAQSKFFGLVMNLIHAETLTNPQPITIRDYLWERDGETRVGDYVERQVVIGSRSEPSGSMWDGGELRYTEGFEVTLMEV